MFALAVGLRIQPVGEAWAVFSPLSGETLILNDEAAAMLEVLADGTADEPAMAVALSADSDAPLDMVQGLVHGALHRLESAGLIVRQDALTVGGQAMLSR